MSTVLDYTGRIDPKTLIAGDVVAVSRYLSWWYQYAGGTHPNVNPKVILADEYDALTDAGVGVVLNWEYDAKDWLGGENAGTVHGIEAARQAKALGYPAGCAIYGSADFDMSAAQWNNGGHTYAVAFAAAICSHGYEPGVYGPWDVLGWCRGIMTYFWQAGMSTAWSGGRNKARWPGVHMRQTHSGTFAGQDVDYNEIVIDDFGQTGGDKMLTFREKADIARLVLTGTSYSEGYASAQGPEYADLAPASVGPQVSKLAPAGAVDPAALAVALAAVPGFAEAVGKAMGAELAARLAG